MNASLLLRSLMLATMVAVASIAVVACANTTNEPGPQVGGIAPGNPPFTIEAEMEGAVAGTVTGGVPAVHVSGDAYAMGLQHGTLLSGKVHEVLDGFILPFAESRGGRMAFDVAAEAATEKMSDSERREMQGIAEGSGRPIEDIRMLNVFFDAAVALAGREGHNLPLAGASIGIDNKGQMDGMMMLGQNIETETIGVAARPQTVVFVHHPAIGKPFTRVAFAGMIGSYSGMNLDGVAYSATPVPSPLGFNPAIPFSVLGRRVLEEADNVEIASQVILGADISTSHNVMMADTQGRVWQIEASIERIVVKKNDRGQEYGSHVLFCANHFVDSEMETQQGPRDVASQNREDAFNEAKQGRESQSFYWDSESVFNALEEACISRNRTASVVYYPEHQVMYVGLAGAENGFEFVRLDASLTYGILNPALGRR